MNKIRLLFVALILLSFKFGSGQNNWNIISQPGINLIIMDDSTAYTFNNEDVGSHGMKYTLKKSTDGFLTFNTIKSKSGDMGCYWLDEMFWVNDDVGLVAEICQGVASIYSTLDGGETWMDTGWSGTYGMSMYFMNDTLGGYYAFNPGKSYLLYSGTNVFETDEYRFKNDNGLNPSNITRIKFTNDSIGFIICNKSLSDTASYILRTNNAGYTWTEKTMLDIWHFTDIYFVSDSLGFVIGSKGHILKTIDGGEEWFLVNSNVEYDLKSIDFASGIGYIVGEKGLILKTQDYGDSWSQEYFVNENDLIYVRLMNSEQIYINDFNGTLYSNQVNSGTPEQRYADISVYPSPTKETLNIVCPESLGSCIFTLYDCHAKDLLTTTSCKINLAKYPAGVYILEIKTGHGDYMKKIIKQ